MKNGWIKLHRQLREHEIYKNTTALHLWIECLFRASHEDRKVLLKRQRLDLDAGSFVFGYRELSVVANCSPSTAKFWMDYFEAERMIERTTTAKGTICKLKNWKEYQSTERESERSANAERTLSESNKNVKNDKNVRSNVPSADDTSDNRKLCSDLYDGMLSANEAEKTADEKNPKRREQKVSAWVKSVGQLKRIDGATDQQITFVIKWLFSSGKKNAVFWQKNIRSGATLREKWSQLVANCKEDYARKEHGSLTIPSNDEIRQMESQGIQFL
jgi:hypothetical protein